MQCKSMGALWEVLFQDTSADSSGSLYDKNYTKKDNCQHSEIIWCYDGGKKRRLASVPDITL